MDTATLRTQLCRSPAVTAPIALAAIAVDGEDAEAFLQGQLTLDLRDLGTSDHRLTAWCNAKGRVWALPRVFRRGSGFVLLVPDDQAEAFVRRLQMFVLRARATLQRLELVAQGQIEAGGAAGLEADDGGYRLGLDDAHALRLQTASRAPSGGDADARYKALRLLAGEPQIAAATQEKFLPQSLDLQALGGLHFNKGCYVGQEIVARVHYRGRTPQHMVTLINPEEARLDGVYLLDEVHVAGQRIVQVVENVRRDASA